MVVPEFYEDMVRPNCFPQLFFILHLYLLRINTVFRVAARVRAVQGDSKFFSHEIPPILLISR